MDGVALKLFNMSLAAGWLVLAAILFRLLFRKAPKWILCLAWGLVGLRLLLPFTVQSPLSLVPSEEPVRMETSSGERRAVFSSGIPVIAAIGHEINRSLADEAADFSVATPTAAAELLIRTVRERRLRAEARARRMLVFRILLVIAGVLAMAALFWFLRSR